MVGGVDVQFMRSVIQHHICSGNHPVNDIFGPAHFEQVEFGHVDQIHFRQFLVVFPLVQVGNINVGLIVPHPFLVVVPVGHLEFHVIHPVLGILGQRVQHYRMGVKIPDGILGFDVQHRQVLNAGQHPQDLLGSGFVLHDNGEEVVVKHGEAAYQLPLLLKRPHQGFIGDPHCHRHPPFLCVFIILAFFEQINRRMKSHNFSPQTVPPAERSSSWRPPS